MSTHSSKVDEFASLFRSSLRPHIEVDKLPLSRVLVLLDSEGLQAKREAVVAITADMADRFRVDVHLLAPVQRLQREVQVNTNRADELLAEALKMVREAGPRQKITGEVIVDSTVRAVLTSVKSYKPDLVILSSLLGECDEDLEGYSLGSAVDRILNSLAIPILLIEGPVADIGRLWSDILVYVESQETVTPCFSATRSLAVKGAQVELLHVLDEHWLQQLRTGLALTREVGTDASYDAIRTSLKEQIQHYLEAAVEALDRTGHNTTFEILEGDPIDITRQRIRSRQYGLLICNSSAPDEKLVDSIAYNLAAYLREVPLLLV